jgi:hypothetical protein
VAEAGSYHKEKKEMNIAQKQVFTSIAKGVPGQKASLNEGFHYYPNTLMAEVALAVGGFAWLGSDPETLATNKGPADTKPVGFVERNIVYPDYDPLSPGTLTVPPGSALAVAVSGDFWAVAAQDATVGQKVFAVSADGSLTVGAAGATVSGAVETDWSVVTAGLAGEPIIISSH